MEVGAILVPLTVVHFTTTAVACSTNKLEVDELPGRAAQRSWKTWLDFYDKYPVTANPVSIWETIANEYAARPIRAPMMARRYSEP